MTLDRIEKEREEKEAELRKEGKTSHFRFGARSQTSETEGKQGEEEEEEMDGKEVGVCGEGGTRSERLGVTFVRVEDEDWMGFERG